MIRVWVEVNDGGVSFKQPVTARSIEHALTLVKPLYSGSTVRMPFPIEPEVFFVGEVPAAVHIQQEMIQQETTEEIAG